MTDGIDSLPRVESTVQIVVREKPSQLIHELPESAIGKEKDENGKTVLNVGGQYFQFDYVAEPDVTQEVLYESTLRPLVMKVLEGFNCTVLAYGQTGTGKSYTMGLNAENSTGTNAGFIKRSLQDIFTIARTSNGDKEYSIALSFIEIYNDNVYDLLAPDVNQSIHKKGTRFTVNTKRKVEVLGDEEKILNEGNRNRHVRTTKMNPASSRSHAIFKIHVTVRSDNKRTESVLNIVDLAGSENAKRNETEGVALTETISINKGLLTMGRVLTALTSGIKAVPFRESVLTMILQDSLNVNSYFLLLACISPCKEDISVTLSTLKFAETSGGLKHAPTINTVATPRHKTPKKSLMKTPLRPNVHSSQKLAVRNTTLNVNNKSTINGLKRISQMPSFQNCMILKPSNNSTGQIENQSMDSTFDLDSTTSAWKSTQFNSTAVRTSTAVKNNDHFSRISAIQKMPTESMSPVMKRCFKEFEEAMENKMKRMLETMITKDPITDTNNVVHKPQLNENVIINALKMSMKDIVREEIQRIERTMICAESTRVEDDFIKPMGPPPRKRLHMELTNCNETTAIDEMPSIIENNITVLPTQKNRRLGLRNNSTNHPIRSSLRISMKNNASSMMNNTEVNKTTQLKEKEVKKTKKNPSRNSLMIQYFGKENDTVGKSKEYIKNQHCKAVLNLLNTGNLKDIQLLPQIGIKTAYQIITHRSMNGKFKNLNAVSTLPVWRGKGWERFQKANNID